MKLVTVNTNTVTASLLIEKTTNDVLPLGLLP